MRPEDLNRHSVIENIQMADRYDTPNHQGNANKSIRKSRSHQLKMAVIRQEVCVGENVGERNPCAATGKIVCIFLRTSDEIPYDAALPLLGFHLTRMKR